MFIDRLLSSPAFGAFARVLVTFVFWSSGLAKLFDFAGAATEMEKYGVLPAAPMAAVVIMVQLGGSALVISGWNVWLGAGALGMFTALTIPIAHAFWGMTGEAAFFEMLFAIEHISVIGGLMLVAILRRPAAAAAGRLANA